MLAVIGGTGLNDLDKLDGFERLRTEQLSSRYAGEPVDVGVFAYAGHEFLFLPRHGKSHVVPPHRINYRANIDALKSAGAEAIVAMNAVGGIADNLGPGVLAIPDQIIDYSYGRESCFYLGAGDEVVHCDFAEPYCAVLRAQLIEAAQKAGAGSAEIVRAGVYGCTQGPRLETAAEIARMRADGCTMVGMTGMPEAALAREAELSYASLALSVNWAAGLVKEPITLDEIYAVVAAAEPRLQQTIAAMVLSLGKA